MMAIVISSSIKVKPAARMWDLTRQCVSENNSEVFIFSFLSCLGLFRKFEEEGGSLRELRSVDFSSQRSVPDGKRLTGAQRFPFISSG